MTSPTTPPSSGVEPVEEMRPQPPLPAGGDGDSSLLSLWRRIQAINGRMLFGGILVVFILLLAAAAPLLATHDPLRVETANRLAPPSLDNLFGTDSNGRDVYSRVLHGARVSIFIGGAVVVLSTVFGTVTGLVAGYFRRLDGALMRVMDAFLAFPSILLAIAIIAAIGQSAQNVIFALTISYIPRTARVVRGKVLSIREETYVESARAIGLGDTRIIYRYVLPNALAPLMVQATFILALAIIAEAGLSFIGAGTPIPVPSWGNILADGRAFMHNAWWITIAPGAFIMLSVLGLNIFGDGLRDMLDPRMKDD